MGMDNDWYKQIWETLDALYSKRYSGDTFESVDVTRIVPFAEEVKQHLEEFLIEIVARTKANDEDLEERLKYRRTVLASKGYADAKPHFAPIRPK